jgi:23S rRNA (adenine2503-C2)-methyltransferase
MLPNLIGLPKEELKALLDLPTFRINQLWSWIYEKGVCAFQDMSDLSISLREGLAERFSLALPEITTDQLSIDGTQKWLLRFADKKEAETVFIPETYRGTLCVSSQVGCTLTCAFCHTGTQKWVRNLTAGEVLGQFMVARNVLKDWPLSSTAPRHLTNVVMMGMGEPLYNYENVKQALLILMDPKGIGFSKRKITLSTSGVIPFIEKCGAELGVNLAISLHAVSNDVRDKIMPINRSYPLERLIEVCRSYPVLSRMRRITFEYVMLADVNDQDHDARELCRLIKGIPCKINLIPFNPWPGTIFECSKPERIKAFEEILSKAGLIATIREARGQDILAACGQLKSTSENLRKRGTPCSAA